MRDPAGKPAPAGGFKQGGWYSGYQYYNGSFAPSAGVIHPSSPQQGAGQAVSQEVNRQTSVAAGLAPDANQNYVNQQNAQPPSNPGAIGSGGGFSQAGTAGTGSGAGFSTPEVLNLPKLYEQLYASSGIKDLEGTYSQREKEYIEAKGKINDNPFLSEATRVGRVAKLETLFGERTANLKNDIATKKADIEMKLNLETKQFDINSQASQQALSQFNTLLSMGALDNASGEDIANITRSTGLSSQAIFSAIKFNKDKNVQTSVIQYDDGDNQGYAVINSQTGDIISKQVIGSSKARGGSSADIKTQEMQATQKNAANDARNGATLQQLIGHYGVAGGLTVDQIYAIYNGNTSRGIAKESLNQAKQGIFANQKGFKSEAQLKDEEAKRKLYGG